ncbi:MAG: tyrosine-type recombinase/integrase [Verrucomicrobiaceae bacterium]
MSKHHRSSLSAPSAQPVHSQNAQPGKSKEAGNVSRADVRYWLDKVQKVVGRNGSESPNYSVQIAHLGRRHRFKLRTPEKRAAAARAQAIYRTILEQGWDKALASHNPKAARRTGCATIAEYLAELKATVAFRASTWRAYVQALRSIAAGVADVDDQPALDEDGQPRKDRRGRIIYVSRRDRYNGGVTAWQAKVDALPLAVLTDEAVQKWKLAYLAENGGNPVLRQRAKHTLNAMIRSARSLFSDRKGRLKHLRAKLALPDPLPFKGVAMEDESSKRYVSRVDARQLIAAAKSDLAGDESRREQFKAFCLGLLAGLRKRELDTLLWDQVKFDLAQIHICRTEFFEPKSKESEAKVDCDSELLALLRGWKAQARGPFVIETKRKPRYGKAPVGYYRCEEHFRPLYAWLAEQGIKDQKPLHTLRKELGSILANEQGIFAAQQVLRHAHIQTTARHYADKRRPITAGLGVLLADVAEPGKVIGFVAPDEPQRIPKRKARSA